MPMSDGQALLAATRIIRDAALSDELYESLTAVSGAIAHRPNYTALVALYTCVAVVEHQLLIELPDDEKKQVAHALHKLTKTLAADNGMLGELRNRGTLVKVTLPDV